MADSAEQFQCLVRVYERVCEKRKLRLNVDKNKVILAEIDVRPVLLNVRLNGETRGGALIKVSWQMLISGRSERGCKYKGNA